MTNLSYKLNGSIVSESKIATDITDILTVCKQYSILGINIQQQVEFLIEDGIEEAVKNGKVNHQVLPYIRDFLESITKNEFFGDAVDQAYSMMMMIDHYELTHKEVIKRESN